MMLGVFMKSYVLPAAILLAAAVPALFAQAPALVGACFILASDLTRIFHALERRVRARGLQASPHVALTGFP